MRLKTDSGARDVARSPGAALVSSGRCTVFARACAAAVLLGLPCAPGTPAAAQSVVPVSPAATGTGWSADGLARLQRDLTALLSVPALREAHVGVLAVDTTSGSVLYERNADEAFAPASTLKLLVGSVALDRLGPDFRFLTEAWLTTGPDGAGRLEVKAFGDPLLSAADFGGLAEAVAAKTARVGAMVVDASAFAGPAYPGGWTWDDFGEDYAPPISSATVEENVVHVHLGLDSGGGVSATASPLAAALVPLEPASPAGDLDRAGTDPSCRPDGTFISLRVKARPSEKGDVDASTEGDCTVIDGVVGKDPLDIDVAVPDPPLYFGRVVLGALAARGIDTSAASLEIERGVRTGAAPGEPLWTHRSVRLGSFLGPRFWIPSDNLVGENLLLELALAGAGLPSTREGALGLERGWLRSIGVDPESLTLADGCGMSQYDRITPRALIAILQHDWAGPYRQLVLDSLPVGGVRGTIEGIPGSGAAGRVFAKTGSMMHVRGLAGYLATKRHGAVTFAFNVDDWIGEEASLSRARARVLSRIIDD